MVSTFKVGKYTVILTIPRPTIGATISMACEWEPTIPQRLSKREWREYRAGRDAAFAELSKLTGMPMTMIEL